MEFHRVFFSLDKSILRFVLKSFYADNLLHLFHLLQIGNDGVNIFHVVYVDLDMSFEQAIHRFDENLSDVYIELFTDNIANLVQDT